MEKTMQIIAASAGSGDTAFLVRSAKELVE
jgi:hypothetical protein